VTFYAAAAAVIIAFLSGWNINGWRLKAEIDQLHATWNQAYANQAQATIDKERELNQLNTQIEVQNATQAQTINDAYTDNIKLADTVKRMQRSTRLSNSAMPNNNHACQCTNTATISEFSEQSVQLLVELAKEADDAARYANNCHQWAVGVSEK
jgi:hypothetical protein